MVATEDSSSDFIQLIVCQMNLLPYACSDYRVACTCLEYKVGETLFGLMEFASFFTDRELRCGVSIGLKIKESIDVTFL